MTKDEALKLALEALEDLSHYADLCELLIKETHHGKAFALRERVTKSIKAITAIKEALAQPEQEPDYKAIGQQAYEAGYSTGYMDCAVKMKEQPEQEPVAWLQFKENEKPEVAPRDLGTPVYLGIRGGLAHGIKGEA